MPFDTATHTAPDASAARLALNTAIPTAQEAFGALATAEQRCEQLRRIAYDTPEFKEIIAIRDHLAAAKRAWPRALHLLQTDLQREHAAESSEASMAVLARHSDLCTVGD